MTEGSRPVTSARYTFAEWVAAMLEPSNGSSEGDEVAAEVGVGVGLGRQNVEPRSQLAFDPRSGGGTHGEPSPADMPDSGELTLVLKVGDQAGADGDDRFARQATGSSDPASSGTGDAVSAASDLDTTLRASALRSHTVSVTHLVKGEQARD